ncbi:ABC transporter permease [Streptomyces sp. Li-HN-5-11]|uniref:ABC transporter permease n=1 Tax=Streptomyces sp. Li-HN-5-11 TaxID=3075432 RepID=UPI0028A7F706|nr:ABC transporter permease [Streptomyces sp. Li-HN-5-11]WNM31444.1 ABC transporter permease [Streptomyces sp. Li-HN-5-11]
MLPLHPFRPGGPSRPPQHAPPEAAFLERAAAEYLEGETEVTAPTTTDTTVAPSVPPTEPKARFSDLFAAEWIKLWSLRSTLWAFAATAALVLTSTSANARGDARQYAQHSEEQRALFRTLGLVPDSFPHGSATMLMLGAGAIGAITVLGEYTTGMIRTTFTAVPARSAVMAAKAAVVTVATMLFGAVAALLSYGAAQAVLSGQGIAVGLGHTGIPRLLVASALLAPVSALVGMAVAALVRHSVITIVVTTALLFVLPTLLNDRSHLTASLLHMTVLQAWSRIGDGQAATEQWPWTAGGAGIVLALWSLVAATLTVFSTNHRDQ